MLGPFAYNGVIFGYQKAPGKGGHHLALFDPSSHPVKGHSVTHLTTYGGPLDKGVSIHVTLSKRQSSGG